MTMESQIFQSLAWVLMVINISSSLFKYPSILSTTHLPFSKRVFLKLRMIVMIGTRIRWSSLVQELLKVRFPCIFLLPNVLLHIILTMTNVCFVKGFGSIVRFVCLVLLNNFSIWIPKCVAFVLVRSFPALLVNPVVQRNTLKHPAMLVWNVMELFRRMDCRVRCLHHRQLLLPMMSMPFGFPFWW